MYCCSQSWLFCSQSIYCAGGSYSDSSPYVKWIWDSCCHLKHKFFCLLMIIDMVNTRAMLLRKNFNLPSHACVLCQQCPMKTRITSSSCAPLLWLAGVTCALVLPSKEMSTRFCWNSRGNSTCPILWKLVP